MNYNSDYDCGTRLTQYDSVRSCYVMRPEARQGLHIQKLGQYESAAEYLLAYSLDDLSDEECRIILYDTYNTIAEIERSDADAE